ncbi:MAG: hypothetical protein HYX60_10420 [Legionella longbeachae]|nr:hypothetical protein [Legionella longbeachae]
MLSQKNRFQKWRGDQAAAEQSLLNTALFISEFVESVDNLNEIKSNAEMKFKEFNQNNNRSWATIIYAKLFIDEALEQLSDSAETEKALLSDSSIILSSFYENWKKDAKKNILALIENIEQLFILDTNPFTDKKHYKSFMFSLYMLLQIIKLSIESMNWASKKIAGIFVDLDKLKDKIEYFLTKIEEKDEGLKQLILEENKEEPEPLKGFLNKRYLKILDGNFLKYEKLPLSKVEHPGHENIPRSLLVSMVELEKDIIKVSSGISSLLELKSKKAEIEEKIKNIITLYENLESQDFQDFIMKYADTYQFILENTEEPRKVKFIEKTTQLKNDMESIKLSPGLLNGISWVTSSLKTVYRTTIPQALQNIIAIQLPSTLDSDCKMELKELAKACLDELQKKLKKREQQINAINNRFFHKNKALKQFLTNESFEQIVLLKKANEIIKDAVESCNKLLIKVYQNLNCLHDLKKKGNSLNEFMRINDGFFVRISNFLAQFWSFFKTDTARMIDEASALKKQVDGLAIVYQQSIDQEMNKIQNNPNLDEKIKKYMRRQFNTEEIEVIQEKQNWIKPNKHNIRLLINNLSQLFTRKDDKKIIEEEKESNLIMIGI